MTRVFSLAPIVFGVLGVLGILCSGCSILEPREDPTRFFVLSPGGAETLAPESDAKLSITVGPLRLPAYLLRPEIVTRAAMRGASINSLARELEISLVGIVGPTPIRR